MAKSALRAFLAGSFIKEIASLSLEGRWNHFMNFLVRFSLLLFGLSLIRVEFAALVLWLFFALIHSQYLYTIIANKSMNIYVLSMVSMVIQYKLWRVEKWIHRINMIINEKINIIVNRIDDRFFQYLHHDIFHG